MSKNTSIAVGAALIAIGASAYAFSGRIPSSFKTGKTFYSARDIGQPVDSVNETSTTQDDYEFDFVIVGGGTAAMVLANRLTERSDFKVLVVEAGKRYLQKFETFVPHPEVQCPTDERGKTGPVKTGYFAFFTDLGKAFISSCEAVGIPYVPDFNTSKGTMGVARQATYIDPQGCRVSAETAYLTPEVLARPNLKVVCEAQVTKVRFNGFKRAIGVEFAEKRGGPVYFVGARKEVIVSAGAVNTPQILLLSGVGPEPELLKHSIHVIHPLPGVGQNLTDHLAFNSCFPTRPGYSLLGLLLPKNPWQQLSIARAVAQYMITGKGPMTMNSQESMAFVRLGDGELGRKFGRAGNCSEGGSGEVLEDSASGRGAPDAEILVSPIAWRDHGHKKFDIPEAMTLTAVVLRPTSKGTVTLKSADPWDKPLIDPRYLSTRHDIEILIRGVRLAYELANTEPLKSTLDQNVRHPLLDHALGEKSNAEIEETIRSRAETLYHPACTARMAPLEDGGVVDTRLRVYGVQGLRIVDASVQPEIISGHTAGPTIGIAEKAADLIKEEY